MSDTLNNKRAGAWLPWSAVEVLLCLRLRPCSQWQVFLAVLLTSARHGGRDAKLGIDDLCDLTGLAPRTVKGAVSALQKSGFIVRVRRNYLLSVPLLHHNAVVSSRSKATGLIGYHRSPFTKKQNATITTILSKIYGLRGIDGLSLIISPEFAVRLGYNEPTSYAQAYEKLKSTGTRILAEIFVKSLVAMYNSENIQGQALL